MNSKKKCFVIMPFSKTKSCSEKKWTEIFEYIIKPAVEQRGLGYECERSVPERENIIKGILEALNKANVVIADLTDDNPNVFYELGVRHALTNRTILIAQGEEHIPFDLRPYPVAFYGESPAKIAEFKTEIKKKLQDIETNPERADNPVADFLELKNIDLLSYEKKANLRKLSALISELSENLSGVDILTETLKKIQEERKTERQKYAISLVFYNACLELLLTTQYISLPKDLLVSISTVKFHIDITNKFLYVLQQFYDPVENGLLIGIPDFRKRLVELLKALNRVYLDYMNDNYVEPETPTVILASPEHEEYLKITE